MTALVIAIMANYDRGLPHFSQSPDLRQQSTMHGHSHHQYQHLPHLQQQQQADTYQAQYHEQHLHHRGRQDNRKDLAELDSDEKVRSISPDPLFERHTEATNIELFYDLFFVANLTTFSTVKEVNDGRSLSQYIGFFCILWFTWYQVSLYDVRFSKDSILDRIAKIAQFGVMIGFATCGPQFNAGEKLEKITGAKITSYTQAIDPHLTTFKALSLLMMVSRLVLVFQYLQAMWICRKRQRESILPMSLIAGTEVVAAAIYGFLVFAFRGEHANAYITWYVVAFLETVICTAVSSIWRSISFKGTHLVQRMSLLTLIILGEGVMGLAEKTQNLVVAEMFPLTGTTISDMACVVMILYFMYMLYFDWIQEHHMGTIRQQIWAFLHFPFHLSLVLAVSGANQFVAWRAGTTLTNKITNRLLNLYDDDKNSTLVLEDISNLIDLTISGSYRATRNYDQAVAFTEASETMISTFTNISDTVAQGQLNETAPSMELLLDTLINTVYTAAGFEPKENGNNATEVAGESDTGAALEKGLEESYSTFKIARLVFIYFFVTMGAFIMLSGVIAWISKRNKGRIDKVRLIASFIIGACLALLTLLAVDDSRGNGNIYEGFIDSPWVLPLVALVLLLVVIINHTKLPSSSKAFKWRSRRRSNRDQNRDVDAI